eukprot:Hpha_TRINITY_DN2931_c0_g1::TRINITY_DN2931_c0_g1_i2::g.19598::m.19598
MYEGWVDDEKTHWVYDRFNVSYPNGGVSGAEDFAVYAQMAQFEQAKLLFECHLGMMYEWYTGVLYWKSQSPWPAFRGFFYDWHFRQTGGYFGAKVALGSPLHAMVHNSTLTLANRHLDAQTIDDVCVHHYSHSGARVGSPICMRNLSVPAMGVVHEHLPPAEGGVALTRVRVGGGLVNEYLSAEYRQGTMARSRHTVQKPTLHLRVSHSSTTSATIRVSLVGYHDAVSPLVTGVVISVTAGGYPVLPLFCDMGYFSLLPGEERAVQCDFDPDLSQNGSVTAHAAALNAFPGNVSL